jgi:hypothetical protein
LKKYQTPENEAKNPYARWFCIVTSPATPKGEYGDVYVKTVTLGTRQIDNPFNTTVCVKGTSLHTLEEIGFSMYSITELVLTDFRLWQYLKLSIPQKDVARVKHLLGEHSIAIVCMNSPDFVECCLTDMQTTGKEQQGYGTLHEGT